MSKKRLRHAQIEALRWLQGRVEDQMVRAYISTEIALLERIGYPINSSGTELVFEKKPKINKFLFGELELIDDGERLRHGECRIHGRISTNNGTFEIEKAGDGTIIGQRCGLCASDTNKLPTTNGGSTE